MGRNRAGAEDHPAPPPQPVGGGWPVADVLESIPFRHRLSTKLLGMTAVVALAAIAALWFAERRMQRDMLGQLERSTALLADVVETTTEEAMLDARAGHAYDVVRRVGGLDGIERVRVLDKRGRVVFSTEPLDVGSTIAMRGRACRACHGERAQPLSRAPSAERTEVLDD